MHVLHSWRERGQCFWTTQITENHLWLKNKEKQECGPKPNVMVAMPEHRWRPLFNAAKFGRRSLLDCHAVTLPRRNSR